MGRQSNPVAFNNNNNNKTFLERRSLCLPNIDRF